MRAFRTTPIEYGTKDKILSGLGASEFPGRWNKRYEFATYTSSTPEAAVSERFYHSLLKRIQDYNSKLEELGKANLPSFFYDQVLDFKFKMATIDVEDIEMKDLCKDMDLSNQLSELEMPAKTVEEYRKSSYQKDPWTRVVASKLLAKGHGGIKVLSARSDVGFNIVFFEKNIDLEKIKIEAIVDVTLSAVSESKKEKLKKGVKGSLDHFLIESKDLNGVIQISQY